MLTFNTMWFLDVLIMVKLDVLIMVKLALTWSGFISLEKLFLQSVLTTLSNDSPYPIITMHVLTLTTTQPLFTSSNMRGDLFAVPL